MPVVEKLWQASYTRQLPVLLGTEHTLLVAKASKVPVKCDLNTGWPLS
jgi:hypothetical protein